MGLLVGFIRCQVMNSERLISKRASVPLPMIVKLFMVPFVKSLYDVWFQSEAAWPNCNCEMENKDREVLHRLRISGTAIGDMNVEASVEWQEKEQSLMATFAPRLDNFKQELREKGSLSPPPHLSGEGR